MQYKNGRDRKFYCQRTTKATTANCEPDRGARGGRAGSEEGGVKVDPVGAFDEEDEDTVDGLFQLDGDGNR